MTALPLLAGLLLAGAAAAPPQRSSCIARP